MSRKEIIEEILKYAVMAPSGDNSQPWRFEVNDQIINIFNLSDHDIPLYNHEQKGSMVAHGALVENLIIAASHFGFRVELEFFPSFRVSGQVASLRLKQENFAPDSLFPYLPERATNRKPYSETDLLPAERDIFFKEAEKISGATIHIIDDQEKVRDICEASTINEITVLTTRSLHGIFFEHVVWTAAEELKKRTGLYLATLELKKPQQAIFKLARHWKFLTAANALGLAKKIASDNAKVYAKSSALLVFSCPENTPAGFFSAGRLMERIWLKGIQLGYSAHPVTGVFFLHQRTAAGLAGELASSAVQEINQAYDKIKQLAGLRDETIAMMLRIGRSEPPSARSSRKEPAIIFN